VNELVIARDVLGCHPASELVHEEVHPHERPSLANREGPI